MYKLLLVEAQSRDRQSRVQYLESQGFEVLTAQNGPQGLLLARQYPPDLLLVALDLQGADTLDFLRLLATREDLAALPTIILSERADYSYHRQCATLGADDILVVPHPAHDLGAAIQARLRKQESLTRRYNLLMRHTAERLNRLAHYDSLTNLPNHHLLCQRLGQAMERASATGSSVALLCISLDRLRQINNTLGYPAGDMLLRIASRRIASILPRSATLARLTGNQFAVLCQGIKGKGEVVAIAERIIDCLSQSFSLPEQDVFITLSIGIARYPQDSTHLNVLLRQADAAQSRAKLHKSHAYQFYQADIPIAAGDELALETKLRRALKRGEFQLCYQPKQNLRTCRVEGAEALLRWHEPSSGDISPSRFIPLAEETGLIVPIGEWVLRTACQQVAAWQAHLAYPCQVAINLSSVQLNQPHLCDTLAQILQETGLPAHQVQLEMTETALMQDVDAAITLLHQFKALGVQVALDDFGTGYASLGYLQQLPIDTLKVDACFVQGVTHNHKNQALLRHIIALAHDLDLSVVAEGVEHLEEAEWLRAYGCDAIQGYWVGSPMSAAALLAKLKLPSPNNGRDLGLVR